MTSERFIRNYVFPTMVFCLFAAASAPQMLFAQKNKTLGLGSCGLGQNNCHMTENNWYRNDPHKATVDKLADDPEAAAKYADLAGIGAANYLKGSSTCMKCHGTVVSGREGSEVEDGVSCESCHGPGSGYKDPHQEGKGGGAARAGYVKGLQTGMADLKNLNIRASACVRCHSITDEKLLAAGHSTGAKFNYVAGLKKVAKHWKRAPTAEDVSKELFDNAKKGRGSATKIAAVTPSQKAAPATPTTPPATPSQPAARQPRQPSTASPAPSMPVRRPPPPPPPPPVTDIDAAPPMAAPVELPPFPDVSDSLPLSKRIVLIKQRLELLQQKTR